MRVLDEKRSPCWMWRCITANGTIKKKKKFKFKKRSDGWMRLGWGKGKEPGGGLKPRELDDIFG
jgi:hypothetical protein